MLHTIIIKVVFAIASWGKWSIVGAYTLAVIAKYIKPQRLVLSWRTLHALYLSLIVVWIGFVAVGQYLFWGANDVTKVFATSPIPDQVHLIGLSILLIPLRHLSHGYLAYTIFMKFLSPLIWQLGVMGVLVFVMKVAKSKRPHLFNSDEVNLLGAAALVAGWPGALVIAPLFFGLFLGHNIANLSRGIKRTEIGLSAAVCLFAGIVLRMKLPALLWIFGT